MVGKASSRRWAAQQIADDAQRTRMAEGETIHTENGLKYGPRDLAVLVRAGGWSPIKMWTDRDALSRLDRAGTWQCEFAS
jgi:uncharacterized SAM-dependent methyltransferase